MYYIKENQLTDGLVTWDICTETPNATVVIQCLSYDCATELIEQLDLHSDGVKVLCHHLVIIHALKELTASVAAFKAAHEQYKFGMVIPPRMLEAYSQACAALKFDEVQP